MGHAIVGHLWKTAILFKKSLLSRGTGPGATWFVPDEDSKLYTKRKFGTQNGLLWVVT